MSNKQLCTFFNFREHWSNKVKPILNDMEVQQALNEGMSKYVKQLNRYNKLEGIDSRAVWRDGGCPFLYADLSQIAPHQRIQPKAGSLEFYQPFGKCHWIAPFSLVLAQKIYPHDKWLIQKDLRQHSTVTNKSRTIVFDILLFERNYTAREALVFAGDKPLSDTEKEYQHILKELDEIDFCRSFKGEEWFFKQQRLLVERLLIVKMQVQAPGTLILPA